MTQTTPASPATTSPATTTASPANRWQHDGRDADPWSALSSIIAGVLLWGAVGWGLAAWLHARAFIGAGLVVGGVLGVVSVYLRYGRGQSGPPVTAGPVLSAQPMRSTPTTSSAEEDTP